MKSGLVLAAPNHPLIHCSAIHRGDCAFMTVVCPSCREAVFKVEGSDREYLSHYPAGGRRDCELRVHQIVRDQDAPSESSIMGLTRTLISDADLEAHLARIESILLDILDESVNGQHPRGLPYDRTRNFWKITIERMRSRQNFRGVVLSFRPYFRMYFEKAVHENAHHPYIRLYDSVYRYLTASNSNRALIFAACYGCVLMMINYNAIRLDHRTTDYHHFVNLTNHQLVKWMRHEVTDHKSELKKGSRLGYAIYLCVQQFLCIVNHRDVS